MRNTTRPKNFVDYCSQPPSYEEAALSSSTGMSGGVPSP
jgi:hypothetical protein